MLIGFISIGFAVRLVRRVGRHHAPRTEIARERLSQLRRMWALLVAGGGASFAGVAFVLNSIHHWFVNPERNPATGADPDRPHFDPDRYRAAGGHHGGLYFRPQPDADDVRRAFRPRRAADERSVFQLSLISLNCVTEQFWHRSTDDAYGRSSVTQRHGRRSMTRPQQIAVGNERRGARALEGLSVRGHPARRPRPRGDDPAAARKPRRHHLPGLDVSDQRASAG